MTDEHPDTRTTRRQFLGGMAALALSGCEPTDERKKELASLGIEFPAILYIAYQGCLPDSGPHNIENLERINNAAKRKNIPVYVIDIGFPAFALTENGEITTISQTPTKTITGEPLPGTTLLLGPTAIERVNTIGFPVNRDNISGHSGKVVIIDKNLDEVFSATSRGNNVNAFISKIDTVKQSPITSIGG